MDKNIYSKTFITSYFCKLGLNNNEASILYTLLEQGQLTILELSRLTEIERTKIYGITDSLLKKGLIEKVIDYKRKYLKICNVNKIELEINKQFENVEYLKSAFPSLCTYMSFFESEYHPTKVLFYRGKDGIKQMLWNELKAKRKKLFAYSYRNLQEITGPKFFRKYAKEFMRKNMIIEDLRSEEFIKSEADSNYEIIKLKGDIVRYISPKILNINIEIDLYDDITAIFNWYKGEIFGVEIYNNKLAELLTQMFRTFWNIAKKDPKEID